MEQLETLLSQKNYDFDDPYQDKDYEGEFNLLKNEKEFIQKALLKTGGNQKIAALLLKTNIRTFYRQIKRHNLKSFLEDVVIKRKESKIKSMYIKEICDKIQELNNVIDLQIEDKEEMLDVLKERLHENEKKEIELDIRLLKEYKEKGENFINCMTKK